MRREDLTHVLSRIPDVEHPRLQLLLRPGMILSLDTVVRFEENYMVVRGRVAGDTDESRGFFVPYEEIVMLKYEKTLKLADLMMIYGADDAGVPQLQSSAPTAVSDATPAPVAPAPAPMNPAEIARKNLLDRIRAAKSITSR